MEEENKYVTPWKPGEDSKSERSAMVPGDGVECTE